MPVSRIAFALHDAVMEIKGLTGGADRRPDFAIDLRMDHRTYDDVVNALEHHFGAKLKKDDHHRGPGQAVWYAGMRLVSVLPGNRPL